MAEHLVEFQSVLESDESRFGAPTIRKLTIPSATNAADRRKISNWISWKGAPYAAKRHSEYLLLPSYLAKEPQRLLVSAVIHGLVSIEQYLSELGSNRRSKLKWKEATSRGFVAKKIRPEERAAEISEIITSSNERQGKPIDPRFLQRGPRHRFLEYSEDFGRELKDLCVGVETSRGSLVAYLLGKRVGDHIFYDEIMGHAEYLQYGVVDLMHIFFLEKSLEIESSSLVLHYGSWYSGSHARDPSQGLNRWKRNRGFRPAYLTLSSFSGVNPGQERLS